MPGRLNRFVATAAGIGYTPVAPGTAGAAAGVIAWYFVNRYSPAMIYVESLLIIISFCAGVYCSGKMTGQWGDDPKQIVIDEVAGMWIALFLIPFTVINFAAAFILFRFFDILKPLGIRKAESFKGGWGIMLDDVAAGIYSNIILQLLLKIKLW